MEGSFHCQECPNKKTFQNRRRYIQHVRENHRNAPFSCHHCGYQTKFKVTLSRHIERNHSPNYEKHSKKKSIRVHYHKCPMCIFECASRQNMTEHYVNNHHISMDERKLEFDDYDRFLMWKESIEQSEVCQFSSRTGPSDRRNVRIRYYRCFRDGHFHTKGKGLRHMKMIGSIKINGVCPAMMKAEEDKATGVVRVSYIPTHVGHLQELGRLNLSKSERVEIAQKVAMGIPHGTILDTIRESVKNQDIRRLHLTTRKDIWNVQSSIGLMGTEKGFIPEPSAT
ncbi:hypothetical protein GE061_005400 [Apolygus lucorum]|uniref:Uncharacterized protein n=1 Tax=Apolygus lucorum TaxID=248454 RepID=A0A6A4ITS9_APOLU|nr:hypothetical protein GE061_005400 [Apolygus lucorum]